MRKLLLAVIALGGLTALSTAGAMAQPYEGRPHGAHEQRMVNRADYEHNHHKYHHRRYEHGQWHYWD